MRRKHGERFAIVSLYTVFGLQGVLMFVVSLPITMGQRDTRAGAGFIVLLGFVVWIVGLYFEAVGDAQLARFKRDPRNAGQIMDQGLWALTRHPNYFGDALVWWGLAIVGSSQGAGVWAFLGAAVMTVLLVRVSGAAMLDRLLAKRKPATPSTWREPAVSFRCRNGPPRFVHHDAIGQCVNVRLIVGHNKSNEAVLGDELLQQSAQLGARCRVQ